MSSSSSADARRPGQIKPWRLESTMLAVVFGGVFLLLSLLALIVYLVNRRFSSNVTRLRAKVDAAVTVPKARIAQPEVEHFSLAYKDLSLTVGDKTILDKVTGTFRQGKLCAVMGPSGCGKSSLLSAVSGRAKYGRVTGSILLNGVEAQLERYLRVVGFVPQEDVMIRQLTVEENLYYAARTRLPETYSDLDVDLAVEETLQRLNLGHIRHSAIGDEDVRGISGGQRKRVNIGLELVAAPSMLFLDEPTSGLDATSSKEVLELLQRLARTGLMIVAVIHQPRWEIFELFDDVTFLGFGGRPVYSGPRSQAAEYFAQLGFHCPAGVNPADFYMDAISGAYDQMLDDSEDEDSSEVEEDEEEREELMDSPPLPPAPSPVPAPSLRPTRALPEGKTTCARLQAAWVLRKETSNSDNSEAIHELLSSSGTDLPHPAKNKGPLPSNRAFWLEFALFFFICAAFPYALVGLVFRKRWGYHKAADLGSFFGTNIALLFWSGGIVGSAEALDVPWRGTSPTDFEGLFLVPVFMTLIVITLILILFGCYILWYLFRRGSDIPTAAMRTYMLGVLTGPLILIVFCLPTTRRTGLAAGAGLFTTLLIILPAVIFQYGLFLSPYTDERWIIAGITQIVTLSTLVVAFLFHMRKVPQTERITKGFLTQVFIFAEREFALIVRGWRALLFHVVQLLMGSLFIGILYAGVQYAGPILPNESCPDSVFDNPNLSFLQPLCYFLLLPMSDPLAPIASLSSLTIALSSVAYAIPVFGRELTVYRRETGSGVSGPAYYLGKSLAHLVINIIAPFLFLLGFAMFVPLKAPLWEHYIILFLGYFTFAGAGFFVSTVVPGAVAQLVGVFLVLANMMFSGAQPTLSQLVNNPLIPFALLIPSFMSYFRWSIELFYVTEVVYYAVNESTLTHLFSYSTHTVGRSWSYMIFFAVFFRLATYISLLIKEE